MDKFINQIIHGNALEVLPSLKSESVQCCVTSPPYWGLRDYGVSNQLGLEKTPEEYIANLVTVFREIRRVLKKEGTLWLNIGDSYAATTKQSGRNDANNNFRPGRSEAGAKTKIKVDIGALKPKDLVGIPWMLAFALRSDGWYLRQDIIWHKPNPMPESVTDRCTKAHEYLFLLSKSKDYYCDMEAIKEPAAYDGRTDERFKGSKKKYDKAVPSGKPNAFLIRGSNRWKKDDNGNRIRNKRSVWTIATKPCNEAHFAVMPEALVEPCIKAGTSEKGCCPVCGKSWIRIVRKRTDKNSRGAAKKTDYSQSGSIEGRCGDVQSVTIGWQPTCSCGVEPIPCIVIDPFAGAGTVGMVAKKLGRSFIGIELNSDYADIGYKRIANAGMQLAGVA